MRPDLSREQSWEVLQRAEQRHDGDTGITFNRLDVQAEEMFPKYHQDLPAGASMATASLARRNGGNSRPNGRTITGYVLRMIQAAKVARRSRRTFRLPWRAPELLVTPADLMDSIAQAWEPDGVGHARRCRWPTPEPSRADVKECLKDSPADIGREELGRLPTQDPARQCLSPSSDADINGL